MSGRKTVLATAANSLERAGCDVEAVVLSRTPPEPHWQGRTVHHVPLPGLPRTAVSGVRVLTGGSGSLNEALFDSPAVRRRTAELVRSRDAALVVDGLRTAGPALAGDAPVLVHLDDLLSDRYAALAREAAAPDLLGFFAEQLPRVLRPPAQRVAGRLLALEARRVDARERELAQTAHAVAMTSQDEADELARRTGRPVVALPMSVDVRPAGDPAEADPGSIVFLGLLDYAPNRAALRWWSEQVRPALDALGGQDVHLTVVGHQSDSAGVADPRVHFTGYVDDLGTELRRHRAMVAPVLTGAGVKTKVLDGWSVGLPVVATSAGAAGLDRAAGLLVADDASAFAHAVLRLRDDAALARSTGAAGRAALEQEWSSRALARRWTDAVQPLQP